MGLARRAEIPALRNHGAARRDLVQRVGRQAEHACPLRSENAKIRELDHSLRRRRCAQHDAHNGRARPRPRRKRRQRSRSRFDPLSLSMLGRNDDPLAAFVRRGQSLMRRTRMPTIDQSPDPLELNISDEKLAFLILKAREFDAEVDPVAPDPGSNPTDDRDVGVLEDIPENSTEAELRDALHALNEDEAIDVIALMWIGRGDFSREEWEEAR